MNDQAVIVLELRNPVLDISGGVAVGVHVGNAGDSAKKSRTHLRNQFFLAVTLVAETIAEGAIEAALVSSAVSKFVKKRSVVMRRSRITIDFYQQSVSGKKRDAQALAFRGLLGEVEKLSTLQHPKSGKKEEVATVNA